MGLVSYIVTRAFASPAQKKAYWVMDLLVKNYVRSEVPPRESWEKDKAEIIALIRDGADLAARVPASDPSFPTYTILHLVACDHLFLEVAEEVLKRKVEVDARTSDHKTPFSMAASGAHVFDDEGMRRRSAMIDLFLAAKADVNAQDKIGNTIATWCLNDEDAEVQLPKLIKAGLNIHETSGDMAEPLISHAMRLRRLAALKLLREAGASLDQADKDGDTGLMRILRNASWSLDDMTHFSNFWPFVEFCLDTKANLLHTNNDGQTVYGCVPWQDLDKKLMLPEARGALKRLEQAYKDATQAGAMTVRADIAQPDVVVAAPKKLILK
jgi:hypothetical protein